MVWNPSYERIIVRKNIGVRELQCPVCRNKMKVVEEDYSFKGNSDIHWQCSNRECLTCCTEEVRFNQSFKELWYHNGFDTQEKEWVIKKKIDVKRGGKKR